MDALGNVATRTGAALFQGENADLRSSFGHQMRDLLKSGVEAFDEDGEKLVVEAEDAGETANPAETVRSVDEEGDVL